LLPEPAETRADEQLLSESLGMAASLTYLFTN
jgi:hypothetical protein